MQEMAERQNTQQASYARPWSLITLHQTKFCRKTSSLGPRRTWPN